MTEVAVKTADAVAEAYYDSGDADRFYFGVWGGEDIHIGLYDQTSDIAAASRLTVERMASVLGDLGGSTQVLDVGSGYGGAARYLAKDSGCSVHCLNISETQNATNRRLNAEQGLSDKIKVVHGSFEDVPEPDGCFDVVWSQDAILHSGNRKGVFSEVFRVLKPGGRFVFTDPMQADDCPPGVLQPVYDRIHLKSLGSFAYYRRTAAEIGFDERDVIDLTPQLRVHYHRVGEDLKARYHTLSATVSTDYMDRMLLGLENWVTAADSGYLAWGILHFQKPQQ